MGLFAKPLLAQEVNVEWGPLQKEIKGSYIYKIINNDDKGFNLVRIKSGGFFSSSKYYFERVNADNAVEWTTEFLVENNQKKECALENVLPIKGGFIVFMSYYDSKADKNIFYGQTYDENGKSTSNAEEMDEISSKKRRNSGEFSTLISDNGTKILVYRQEPYEKNKNEKFNYKVFDNSLKLLWEKPVELPYKDKDVSIFSYTLDNEGYVYALEKIENTIKVSGLFAKDKKVYDFKVITFDYKKDKLDEIPLKLGGARFVTDVTFTIDNAKGKILVTGFFANKEYAGIAGSIFMRIDKKTFKVEHENAAAFDKEFITKAYANLLSEKKAKKQKNLSSSYDLKQIIIKSDGGIILVAEEYFVEVVTYTTTSANGVSTTRTTYYYNYRNIVVIDLNQDGTIRMASVVPKYQYSINDGGPYASFISTYYNDKLYFWYNDNPKNTSAKTKPDKKGKYIMNKPKNAMVTMAVLDKEGNLTQEAFFKSKNEAKCILKPKLHEAFNPDKILVYAEFKSDYKFGFFRLTK